MNPANPMLRTCLLALSLLSGSVAVAGPGDPPAQPTAEERPAAGPRGFGGPRGDRGARMEMRRERILEREADILRQVAALSPERHEALVALKGGDQQVYLRVMMQLNRVLKASDTDPDAVDRFFAMMDLQVALREHAAAYPTQTPAQQKKTRAAMAGLADKLFELRQAERRARLAEMAARLEELRTEIEDRDAAKGEIIDDYVDGMIKGPKRRKPGF